MEQDIRINYQAVVETHIKMSQLVRQRLGMQGKLMSDKVANRIEESEGDMLLRLKMHMKAEQELMNNIGDLLLQMTGQIKQATDGFRAKDKEYSKEKTTL